MKPTNQTLIILSIFFGAVLSFSTSANAACPAAPVGSTSDTVVQMKAIGGNAGTGATNVLDATEEGAMVYDDANDTVKVCDGTNWVELGSGGSGSGMIYTDYTNPTHGGNRLRNTVDGIQEFCIENGHTFGLAAIPIQISSQTLAQYSAGSWTTNTSTYSFSKIRCTSGTGGLDASDIDDLGDVDTSGKSTNDVLTWDGTNWVGQAPSGGSGSYDYDPTNGYFVLADTVRFTGGLAEANDFCRQSLSKNIWKGSPGANLNPGKVTAFLCDEASCQNPDSSTTYYFASAGDFSAGGSSFTTNGSGQGPGNTTSWNGASYFNIGSIFVRTGRAAGTSTLWSNSPYAGKTCNSWVGSGYGREGGTSYSNTGRWSAQHTSCTLPAPIICMLHPGS